MNLKWISKRIFSKKIWLTFGITFARVCESGNVSLCYNYTKPPSTKWMASVCPSLNPRAAFLSSLSPKMSASSPPRARADIKLRNVRAQEFLRPPWSQKDLWNLLFGLSWAWVPLMWQGYSAIYLFQLANHCAILDTITRWQKNSVDMKNQMTGMLLGQSSHFTTKSIAKKSILFWWPIPFCNIYIYNMSGNYHGVSKH